MDVVDIVLKDSGIDEKFLGVTLFALVPNTTEFMNAISFALNGNIALRCAQSLHPTNRLIMYAMMLQYGNWFCVRTPGVLVTDSCYGCFFGLVRSKEYG